MGGRLVKGASCPTPAIQGAGLAREAVGKATKEGEEVKETNGLEETGGKALELQDAASCLSTDAGLQRLLPRTFGSREDHYFNFNVAGTLFQGLR